MFEVSYLKYFLSSPEYISLAMLNQCQSSRLHAIVHQLEIVRIKIILNQGVHYTKLVGNRDSLL